MGYNRRALTATCAKCKRKICWSWKPPAKTPHQWKCACGVHNYLNEPPKWPDLPITLYIGHEKNKRLKIHPIPPDMESSEWAQPYSIRSFLYQASRALGGCHYNCCEQGTVMGQKVFSDFCCSPGSVDDNWGEPEQWDCHMASGWINGQDKCALWERVAQLCQTEPEKRFLHRYLGYVKDRQFPMLIPQTWIGITDRRRPDFVAFVPLQFWNYKRIAIELDASHTAAQQSNDEQRNSDISEHKYEVISIKPTNSGYLEEVRTLVEKIDRWMRIADDDSWSVAIEAPVAHFEERPDDDVPF